MGEVRSGMVPLGWARLGQVWHGKARFVEISVPCPVEIEVSESSWGEVEPYEEYKLLQEVTA